MGQHLKKLQEELKETEFEIENLQEKIEALKQKKELLQQQLQEVIETSGKVCPVCGYTELEEEARFCGNCGARLEKEEASEAWETQQVETCPFCGEPLKPKARFCVSCGRVIREHSL